MRPEGRGEHDSLYFHYPHFDPPRRDQARGDQQTEAVAIVGAGPVGLVAALTLANYGVRSIVIDRKATFNDGSRAICIARASYHLLDCVGALAPFLAKSLGWTTGRTFFRGQRILEFEMPHSADEKFLPMYNLQQQYIEQFLYDAASATGLVEFRWQTEASGVAQNGAQVALDLADPAGPYRLTAPWLLAADGARSVVRSFLGKRLQGVNYEGRYVIADVKMAHDYPTIRRALFDPKSNPGGTVLVHKQPDDIWRIDYQLEPGQSAEAATSEAVVREKVAAILTDIGHTGSWDLEWWSVYSANTLALDDYREGRIFFIGDSAHIVPIFGVRGLNNGIADGHNIGWKLAKVIKGEAGARLLDSYTPERRGATLDVFENATKSTRFMTPPGGGWRIMRDAALSLALKHEFARPFANPRQMAPYTYAASPITYRDAASNAPNASAGEFARNLRLSEGGFLLDHIGRGLTAICQPGSELDPKSLALALVTVDPDAKVIVLAPTSSGAAAPMAAGNVVTLVDIGGRIAATYGIGAGGVALIRPDFYLAARWAQTNVQTVLAAARNILDLGSVS